MILICGYGGDDKTVNETEVKQEIVKLCKNKKVAIIGNAKPKGNWGTTDRVSNFLTSCDISNKVFDLYNSDISWQNYDVIYFGGGSPLRLIKAIEECGFKNFNWKSKHIIGQSAGAMILFPYFVDCIDVEGRELTLKDFDLYKGLAVINNKCPKDSTIEVLTPHFNALSGTFAELYLNFLDKNNIQTLKLNDKEFLTF